MLKGSLIVPHSAECFYRKRIKQYGTIWVNPIYKQAKPVGHKWMKAMFVFRCNCPACPAQLGVRSEEMYALWFREMAHLQRKGFAKVTK